MYILNSINSTLTFKLSVHYLAEFVILYYWEIYVFMYFARESKGIILGIYKTFVVYECIVKPNKRRLPKYSATNWINKDKN